MRLLFDQNLPPRLQFKFQEQFPGSVHVRDIGLKGAEDRIIWEFAASNGFAIGTKDADFRQRSFLEGHPPKIVWIRAGNCSTNQIEALLRGALEQIADFLADPQHSILTLAWVSIQ